MPIAEPVAHGDTYADSSAAAEIHERRPVRASGGACTWVALRAKAARAHAASMAARDQAHTAALVDQIAARLKPRAGPSAADRWEALRQRVRAREIAASR